jgi:hypothetical protein
MVPDILPTYEFSWQAYNKAKDLATNRNQHVLAIKNKKYAIEDLSAPVRADVEAEDLLIGHYKTILKDMAGKVIGIDNNTEKEKEMTYEMIKSQVEDLLRIEESAKKDTIKAEINKLIGGYRDIVHAHFQQYLSKDKKEKAEVESTPEVPNMPPMEEGQPQTPNMTMASKRNIIDEKSLLRHYAERACHAIFKIHPDSIYKIEDMSIDIINISGNKVTPIVKLSVNQQFNINNIVPLEGICEYFPSFSPKFYQRYWKPIVEAVEHFVVDEADTMIIPKISSLPDMPNIDGEFKIKGWDIIARKQVPISINFNKNKIWSISASKTAINKTARNYTEEDFLKSQPTRVKCIDQRLQLLGKIGEVVQVVPINSGAGFEIDVNFGRKIVRLDQNQVEIVDDI